MIPYQVRITDNLIDTVDFYLEVFQLDVVQMDKSKGECLLRHEYFSLMIKEGEEQENSEAFSFIVSEDFSKEIYRRAEFHYYRSLEFRNKIKDLIQIKSQEVQLKDPCGHVWRFIFSGFCENALTENMSQSQEMSVGSNLLS